jgi:hypothetical protein
MSTYTMFPSTCFPLGSDTLLSMFLKDLEASLGTIFQDLCQCTHCLCSDLFIGACENLSSQNFLLLQKEEKVRQVVTSPGNL